MTNAPKPAAIQHDSGRCKLAGALVLLYELGILLSVGIYRGKKKRAEEAEASLDPPPGAVESS